MNPTVESYINSLPSPDPNDDAEVFSGPINSGAGDYGDYEDYGDYHYRSFFPRVRTNYNGKLHSFPTIVLWPGASAGDPRVPNQLQL